MSRPPLAKFPWMALSRFGNQVICSWKCDGLLFRCIGRVAMQLFVRKIPRVYRRKKIPISLIFLHRFCQFTFNCWLRTFRSLSNACVWFSTSSSYVGSGGYVTAWAGPFIKVSSWIPSFANNFHCCVHFPTKLVVWWLVFPRTRQCGEESCENLLPTAPCCIQILYDNSIE